MTSCFDYIVTGLSFYDRINTQLIYRFELLAQVVARRITKPQRKFFRFESHWLLSFYSFFFYFRGGGGGGSEKLFAFISEFTVVCVVTDVLNMCLMHVKGIKKTKKKINKKK